jgi:hypothetical protein
MGTGPVTGKGAAPVNGPVDGPGDVAKPGAASGADGDPPGAGSGGAADADTTFNPPRRSRGNSPLTGSGLGPGVDVTRGRDDDALFSSGTWRRSVTRGV